MRTICGQSLRWERGIKVVLNAPASPNAFMSVSKPRWEHPDLLWGLGKAAKETKVVRGRRRKGTLPTCCVYNRVTSQKSRSCHRPKECEHAPRATAREGGGEKSSCQLLCLTVGSGLRAEVRTLQIPTAVVCLQDLRNWTRQLKRNPVV